MRNKLHICAALAVVFLFGLSVLLISGRSTVVAASPVFSPNQELPLPLLAPIGGPNGPVSFVVRGLEPSNRTDGQGTIYVSSIRGVPGGVDLHRWSPLQDGPPNSDGTLPFVYLGQPDGCGVLANGCELLGVAEGGGDVDIAVNHASNGAVPNLPLTSLTLVPGITSTHSTDRGTTFAQPNPIASAILGTTGNGSMPMHRLIVALPGSMTKRSISLSMTQRPLTSMSCVLPTAARPMLRAQAKPSMRIRFRRRDRCRQPAQRTCWDRLRWTRVRAAAPAISIRYSLRPRARPKMRKAFRCAAYTWEFRRTQN